MGGGGSSEKPACKYQEWSPPCSETCKPEGHNPPLEQTQTAKEDPERCKPNTRNHDCTRDLPDCEYDCEYTWEEWGECLGKDGLRVDCGGGERSRQPIWTRKPTAKNTVCDIENKAYTEKCATDKCGEQMSPHTHTNWMTVSGRNGATGTSAHSRARLLARRRPSRHAQDRSRPKHGAAERSARVRRMRSAHALASPSAKAHKSKENSRVWVMVETHMATVASRPRLHTVQNPPLLCYWPFWFWR